MLLKFLDDIDTIRAEEAILGGEPFRSTLDSPYRWHGWAEYRAALSDETARAWKTWGASLDHCGPGRTADHDFILPQRRPLVNTCRHSPQSYRPAPEAT